MLSGYEFVGVVTSVTNGNENRYFIRLQQSDILPSIMSKFEFGCSQGIEDNHEIGKPTFLQTQYAKKMSMFKYEVTVYTEVWAVPKESNKAFFNAVGAWRQLTGLKPFVTILEDFITLGSDKPNLEHELFTEDFYAMLMSKDGL